MSESPAPTSPGDDEAAGRAAADQLVHEWDTPFHGDAPSEVWARAAVSRLADHLREQPAFFRASRRGSERGAESLSPRPFQGLLEVLQNADDLGATEVRVSVRRTAPERHLVIVHDGAPVRLPHVGAMILLWLTTKLEDPSASGRFGIGQRTLTALGGPVSVHCAPFHFSLESDGPHPREPLPTIPGIYAPEHRETLLSLQLNQDVDEAELQRFLVKLGPQGLIFLKSVRRVRFIDVHSGEDVINHQLVASAPKRVAWSLGSRDLVAERVELRSPVGDSFIRYISEIPVAPDDKRYHKATGQTTTVGVAVADSGTAGGFYDRVPLPLTTGFPVSLNAQWDPDTARGTLLARAWNEHRLADCAMLAAAAAADCLRRGSPVGWQFVPLESELGSDSETWLSSRRAVFVAACQTAMADARVLTSGEPRPLNELVWESVALDGLLTEEDQSRLKPGRWAVALSQRGEGGRWRQVLAELAQSEQATVADALELFELEDEGLGDRSPSWFVGMARAALSADLIEQFLSRRSVLLADGRRVESPGHADPHSLVCRLTPGSLAAIAGTALPLHPAYLDGAADVIERLKAAGVLLDDVDDDVAALRVLAREDSSHSLGRVRLDNDALITLRTALERLDDEEQRTLAMRIGHNIELRAITFADTRTTLQSWARPADAYLPAQIDRDRDSFARAAAATVGLIWLDPVYARLLKRAGGRLELGAQRFLSRLGAATAPRLVRPSDEEPPGKRDTRLASRISSISRPELQTVELRAIGGVRTHLLDDRWSPDLDAVMADLRRERNTQRRRRRSLALLTVLARAWERQYSEYQAAQAVYPANGYWQAPHGVIATWLARAASEPWLASASGAVRAPSELALATDANQLVYGRQRSAFLATVPDAVLRSSAIAGLRLRRGPAASDLVRRLREANTAALDENLTNEVLGIYRLLAIACEQRSPRQPLDDMTVSTLRSSFDGRGSSAGLILSDGRWYPRTGVFAGSPIFGRYRAFAPGPVQLAALWRTLDLKRPSLTDAIAVLKEVARRPLADEDRAVVLESIRLVAELLDGASPQLRTSLRHLPLWTGRHWTSERPIFATSDPEVAAALANDIPIWDSGFASYSGLEDVLDALDARLITSEDFEPDMLRPESLVRGDALRPRFALAIQHLRDELAAGDQELHDALAIPWQALQLARVMVDDELQLVAEVGGRQLRLAGRPHFVREPLVFAIPTVSDAGTEAGGRAVASLFTGDQQKVTWAWSTMWGRAEEGQQAQGIVLSTDRSDEVEDPAMLVKLRGSAKARRERGQRRRDSATKAGGVVTVRPIKDISEYEPDSGTVVNEGRDERSLRFPPTTERKPIPEADSEHDDHTPSAKKTSNRQGDQESSTEEKDSKDTRRTVLPPTSEREQLALDAVRHALQLDRSETVDLRARRGLGADAVDELRQLYEIKMESGPEFPAEVTLERSEVQAAQEESDFFLAVVCGLEDTGADLRVRFIFDPLRRLGIRVKGDVTLTGVDKVEALEYRFAKRDE